MKASDEKSLSQSPTSRENNLDKLKHQIANRLWLRESRKVAFRILNRLDELNWTQKELASKMGVSPQQVNKIVKGQENLTLETLVKIQEVLAIPIFAYNEAGAIKSNLRWGVYRKSDEGDRFYYKDMTFPVTRMKGYNMNAEFDNLQKYG